MRLRTVFAIYVLTTAAAAAAPYVMTAHVTELRKRIAVNSESALQSAPTLIMSRPDSGYEKPACIGYSPVPYKEMIYYQNGRQSSSRDPGVPSLPFIDVPNGDFESCTVGLDGTIYVTEASGPRTPWLLAYSPEGHLKWRVATSGDPSRVALGNLAIYVHSLPPSGGSVLTAYKPDGSTMWKIAIGGAEWAPSAPIVGVNGVVYLVAASFKAPAQLVAIDSTGRILWRVEIPGSNPSQIMVGDDGRIFVHVQHGAVAFNDAGEKLWDFTSDNQDPEGGIALAGDGTLLLASRFLYALDHEGKPKWVFRSERTYTDRDYFAYQPVVSLDGTIYENSEYDELYAVTPDGQKKWEQKGDRGNPKLDWKQPLLTDEGLLYTAAGVFSVRNGLATKGWPAENCDNRNSRHLGQNP
jgi:PQQ-like domain